MTEKELNKKIRAYEKFLIDNLNNLFLNQIVTEKQYKDLLKKIISKIDEVNND